LSAGDIGCTLPPLDDGIGDGVDPGAGGGPGAVRVIVGIGVGVDGVGVGGISTTETDSKGRKTVKRLTDIHPRFPSGRRTWTQLAFAFLPSNSTGVPRRYVPSVG